MPARFFRGRPRIRQLHTQMASGALASLQATANTGDARHIKRQRIGEWAQTHLEPAFLFCNQELVAKIRQRRLVFRPEVCYESKREQEHFARRWGCLPFSKECLRVWLWFGSAHLNVSEEAFPQ